MEELRNHEEMATVYHYLGCKDRHLIRLLHWIKIIEDLNDEVRSSEMDTELEKEIEKIVMRLINEVGVRMTMIFPLGY